MLSRFKDEGLDAGSQDLAPHVEQILRQHGGVTTASLRSSQSVGAQASPPHPVIALREHRKSDRSFGVLGRPRPHPHPPRVCHVMILDPSQARLALSCGLKSVTRSRPCVYVRVSRFRRYTLSKRADRPVTPRATVLDPGLFDSATTTTPATATATDQPTPLARRRSTSRSVLRLLTADRLNRSRVIGFR
jgi:hypothetical protein